jgi:DNA (cytosine-5)-methyltransferase 1
VPNSETRRGRVGKGVAQTLDTGCQQGVINNYKIRRLTPRECFRLMDFPDTFTWDVSDSQAYKQAGNSIVVNVLYKILKNLNL